MGRDPGALPFALPKFLQEGLRPTKLEHQCDVGHAPVKIPCVYILASKRNGTLYIGVTSDLYDRMAQHKQGLIEGFTKKYGVHRLVYYEMHDDMTAAIRREKQLKRWKRAWKVRLIEQMNPEWIDLFDETTGELRDAPADRQRKHN